MEQIELIEEQKRVAKEQRKIKKDKIKAGRKIISVELKTEVPEEIRNKIEAKYNHKCAECRKRPGKMQIHHINTNNEDNDLANLEVLCQKHHLERHAKK